MVVFLEKEAIPLIQDLMWFCQMTLNHKLKMSQRLLCATSMRN